jgi:hypothetical protein
MGDSMSTAFADPAKYDLYDCKQLETERKNLATRAAELQGLMAKAETGVAGPRGGRTRLSQRRAGYIAVPRVRPNSRRGSLAAQQVP